ncbi:hypothetical protein H0H93_010181 [Arthromyces matolae]|nr:hypothetical protein H0H93_010181 [Arthromyces matolae]
MFDITGYDSTIGFTQWANKPATTNADTMFAFECANPLWGRTTNPYNNKYTCGGSSGGECALLAMDGSALGIGSDIGGSLRIPAAYCGVYSLKPSTGRISFAGGRDPVDGFEGIKAVVGPLARSVDDLTLVSRTVFGVQGREQSIAPIPYREVQLSSKLRFGYYTSDNLAKASPACQRAVLETVEALRRKGHECIEFELPGAVEALNIFVGLTSADGYKTMLSHLGPDPKDSSLFLVAIGPKLPSFFRSLAAWAIEATLGDKIFADVLRAARVRSTEEFYALVAEREMFIKKFHDEVWRKYGFDGIIAPTQALPQLPHGRLIDSIPSRGCENFNTLAAATTLYNVLDYPVGCVPVTHVKPAKDQITPEWKSSAGHGSPFLENGVYHSKNPLYDPTQSDGMPVGIQIVGKKWEEEKVLAMMDIIDSALGKNRGFGPGSWSSHKERS